MDEGVTFVSSCVRVSWSTASDSWAERMMPMKRSMAPEAPMSTAVRPSSSTFTMTGLRSASPVAR